MQTATLLLHAGPAGSGLPAGRGPMDLAMGVAGVAGPSHRRVRRLRTL